MPGKWDLTRTENFTGHIEMPGSPVSRPELSGGGSGLGALGKQVDHEIKRELQFESISDFVVGCDGFVSGQRNDSDSRIFRTGSNFARQHHGGQLECSER